ncbi:hypothetical protein GCM10018779_59320 [Streptomyces griseocarneus]|nr:hypothetical protein GCM10018779_59320 [Streptomyces griseocarneus]
MQTTSTHARPGRDVTAWFRTPHCPDGHRVAQDAAPGTRPHLVGPTPGQPASLIGAPWAYRSPKNRYALEGNIKQVCGGGNR